MTMNRPGNNREQEVIELLGRLREAGPEYPAQLQARRRAAILASLAVVPVAATGLMGISWIAKLVKIIKAMSFIDKIILGVEVAAITGLTAYGAANAYIYRNVIIQLLLPSSNTPFPTLSVPSTLGVNGTPGAPGQGSETPTPSATLSVTPLATWTGFPTQRIIGTPGIPTVPPVVSTNVPPPTNPPATNPPKATKPAASIWDRPWC